MLHSQIHPMVLFCSTVAVAGGQAVGGLSQRRKAYVVGGSLGMTSTPLGTGRECRCYVFEQC